METFEYWNKFENKNKKRKCSWECGGRKLVGLIWDKGNLIVLPTFFTIPNVCLSLCVSLCLCLYCLSAFTQVSFSPSAPLMFN